MKQIKFLIAVALVSVFAFSCKEAPKEVEEVVVEEVAPVVEEVEVAVDSTAAVVEEEVIEEVQ